MKKYGMLLGLVMLGCWANLMGQNVESGVKAYESGDYKAAMAEFDKLLAQPDALKEKPAARAHFYRAMARVTYVHKAKSNLEGMQMQQIRDLSIGAYEDLMATKKLDVDGKMAADIAAGNKRMLELLMELGKDAHKIAQDLNAKDADKMDSYKDMIRYGEPIIALDKFQYLGYVFLSNGELGLGDSSAALKNYHLATDWFFRSAPKDGDMYIAYTYIQIARLEWALNKNYALAMKTIDAGRTALGNEGKKFETMGNRSPAEKAALSRLRHDIALDIDKAASDLRLAAGKE